MKFSFLDKNKFYHISEKEIKLLIPKVPKNFLTENGYEENKTKRICVCPNIDCCLRAMSKNIKERIFYVYSIETDDFYSPTPKEVPDVLITQEKWIKREIKPKFEMKIKVLEPILNKKYKYKYDNGKKHAFLYDWNYEEIK